MSERPDSSIDHARVAVEAKKVELVDRYLSDFRQAREMARSKDEFVRTGSLGGFSRLKSRLSLWKTLGEGGEPLAPSDQGVRAEFYGSDWSDGDFQDLVERIEGHIEVNRALLSDMLAVPGVRDVLGVTSEARDYKAALRLVEIMKRAGLVGR